MYFYGSFLTQAGETVTVHIVTGNSRTQQVEIGAEGGNIFFSTNPVEISSSVNDTFDHLLRSEATIRLLTRDFIKEFFCASCRDAVVNIFRGDRCVFAGFIEPQVYSQSYNEVYDELEISCIDVLSSLQYSKYRNIGGPGVLYAEVKADADMRSFNDIMLEILDGGCSGLDITGCGTTEYYYDGSKALTATSDRYGIFKGVSVSELLFLGDDEDNVWQQDEVLETILKYLNLHIVQDGLQFHIFSWETIKDDATSISWRGLKSGTVKNTTRSCVEIALENAASCDTSISIGEVFNQIILTCKTENIESLVKSPLEDSDLTSPYTNKQKYMTEYSADGEGVSAFNAFYAMTHDKPTDFEGATVTDWYVQVKNNPQWTFPEPGTGRDFIDKYCQGNANQQALPNRMAKGPCAAIMALGKVDMTPDRKDNSIISKVDMTNYLVISVNGNGKETAQETFPTEESLLSAAPCAIYNGGISGGVYSPSDDSTTNYIVISGGLILNPNMWFSDTYKNLHNRDPWPDKSHPWHNTVPSRNNGDGRYYTQQYFKAATPFADPVWDETVDRGLVPYTGTGPQIYPFISGDSFREDTVSKVPVLACMLIIGDKCVVETGTDGQIPDFEWRKYKTREQCANDQEYYSQSFTIGFNPKIGDYVIGTEFDLQNNISYKLGIDAEGTAIPIKKSDKLSGAVRFMILGPINSQWTGTAVKFPNLWYRPDKTTTGIPLLANVSSIFVKDFEMKIYSDNGQINNVDNSDIVYMSDTREKFVNRKDDINFEINSALTLAECQELGIPDNIRLSTPLDVSTGNGVLSIYDHTKQQQAKAEQLYVDSYYTEYHKPRILMTQKLDDSDETVDRFHTYVHPAMADKKFYVQSISRNLIENYAELTIKEVWND